MARQRTPLWLVLAAAVYLAYFALLVYCHLHRPEPASIPPALTAPSSALSRADRDALNLTLPLGPLALDIAGDGVLFAVRTVQFVTLMLALVIARRRPRDPVALAGGWLLATAAVFSVAVPAGWATAMQALPAAASLLLLAAYVSTVAGGAVFFIFALVFTGHARALMRPAGWGVLTLVAAGVAPYLWHRVSLVYGWTLLRPSMPGGELPVIAVNAVAEIAGFGLLVTHYNRSRNLIEKRRARFVLAGGAAGLMAGTAVMLAAGITGPRPDRPLFASTALAAGMVLFLLFPLSLAYATLRYRLFDIGVVIRLGLRYAVARRALLSVVPIAAAALAFDIWTHGDRPLRDIVTARSGVYVLIAIGAIAAHATRRRWLERLDRRFFRERYDATRILMDLVEQLRAARPFDELASLAVARIETALHPRFIVAGTATATGGPFATAAAFRPEKAPALPEISPTMIEAARALRRPMTIGNGRIELLVPMMTEAGHVGAVLLLGPKRSEEPYSREDLDLLAAIAASLALRLSGSPSTARLQDVELPRKIAGRYRLDRVIGRGGMGVVYEARDLTLDRRVAVKLMRDELVDSPDARGRFEHEARAAAGFSHPNVITVFDFAAPEGGCAMIVMELLEGRTLRDELAGMPLPAPRALGIVRALAGAIDAAHAHGLLHRDLKPENVFLAGGSTGERVKIVDFGIARPLEADAARRDVTLEGALVGTPRYMAPEQLAGGAPATSWDLWALAVIAFEILTGAHPFGGPRPDQLLPPALDRFFARALAPRASDRFASGRDLAAALEGATGGASV